MRGISVALGRTASAAFAAVLVCAVAPAATAQRNSTADLDAYITRAVRDWRIPGLAIAVVKDDSVVFAKGYGVRELGKAGAVDAGTRFAIGSTTKAMTAVALGMLVDEGKVRWDEPVTAYLPGFRVGDPYVTRELTVRDLLTHRAGLGNADQLWASVDYSPEEISARVATLQPAYSLRSGFIYQNIMYAIAGDVIAAASGKPWAEFVRTRIFVPLGMTATEPTLGALAGKGNVAAPHMEIRDTIRAVTNRSVDAVAPAGAVWSSVGDMAKWARFILDSGRVDGKRILSAESYREIMSPQVVAPKSMYTTMSLIRPHFFTYGLGWFLHDYQGQAIAMHTGSIDGMSAIIGLIPDQRVGVYVLANLDHAELRHALMYRVFDLYGGNKQRDWSRELLDLYGGLEAQADSARRQQEQRRVAGTRPSLALDAYAGTYRNTTYGDAVVTVSDGALRFAFGSGRRGRLMHWQYDTFQAQWEDIRMSPSLVVFAPDGTGGVSSVRAFGVSFTRVRARQ
jgi:CubicO group peptidase (beta-lactamase class C family)